VIQYGTEGRGLKKNCGWQESLLKIKQEVKCLDANMVYGYNAVFELIKSGKSINKVLVRNDTRGSRSSEIISQLKNNQIPFQFVERAALDKFCSDENHQGIIAFIASREYAEPEDILNKAREKGEDPFILVLDEVEDPHNLGALIRTADAAGVHGVIIPKRRSAGLTPVVAKTSAGAVEYVLVARVGNIVQTLNFFKKNGCWVSGAEAGGSNVFNCSLTGPRVLVIGGEDKGLGRLVRETCDEIVSLPMFGSITSLNASVAGSILMYEVRRQRQYDITCQSSS